MNIPTKTSLTIKLLVVGLGVFLGCSNHVSAALAASTSYSNPLNSLGSGPADPCILYDGGKYLLYPTEDADNYYYWQSTDAVNWTKKTKIYAGGSVSGYSGTTWAPDVHYDPTSGKYVLYWSQNHQWGAATCATATGTFTDVSTTGFPITDGIDVCDFTDNDGTLYVYWPGSANTMMMRRMTGATNTALTDTRLAFHYTENAYGEANAICEGPVVFRYRDTYYMLYSSGTYSDSSYRVCWATAKDPMGPWVKRGVLMQTASGQGIYGPGHGCNFTDGAGEMWYMYQQLTAPGKMPRQQAIDKLNINQASGDLSVTMTRGGTQTGPVTTGGSTYPTSTLKTPAYGTVVTNGTSVILSASVTAPGGTVSKVEFYANDTLVGTVASSPYNYTYTASTSGRIWFEARCYDSNNALTRSAQNLLIVGNQPPNVSFASPVANATVDSGSGLTLSANASDPDGSVVSVAYYVDGTHIGTATSAPWQVNWKTGTNNYCVLKAMATDNQGMTADASIGLYIRGPQRKGVQIYEAYSYTLGTTNPTPADLGSATAMSGSLSGNTGLRANGWGANHKIVAGLTYTNAGGVLTTSGNAVQLIAAGWDPNQYAGVGFWQWWDVYYGKADPLSYLRTSYGNSAIGDPDRIGWDGGATTVTYISFLMNVNSTTAGGSFLSIDEDIGSSQYNHLLVGANNGQWVLKDNASGTTVNLGPVTANKTTLLVVRYTGASATNTIVDAWVDPVLGSVLGVPNGTYNYVSWVGIVSFNHSVATANALIFDELRLGPTLDSVTP
jgi:hypothetical protein